MNHVIIYNVQFDDHIWSTTACKKLCGQRNPGPIRRKTIVPRSSESRRKQALFIMSHMIEATKVLIKSRENIGAPHANSEALGSRTEAKPAEVWVGRSPHN